MKDTIAELWHGNNKCGFHIDEFWCEYFRPKHEVPDDEEHSSDEGPDEMFRFIKVMK